MSDDESIDVFTFDPTSEGMTEVQSTLATLALVLPERHMVQMTRLDPQPGEMVRLEMAMGPPDELLPRVRWGLREGTLVVEWLDPFFASMSRGKFRELLVNRGLDVA